MIVDQSEQSCAHEGCSCQVPAGQTYCSPHCANATGSPLKSGESRCGCGHPQCGDGAGESRS